MSELDCGFNPAKARAKRAVPLFTDAMLRDTQHLEADEFGAYHALIYAMWKQEDVGFPNNVKKLARVCRVSTRLWNSRVGETLMEFFTIKNDRIFLRKLSEVAREVEKNVTAQHARKCACCKSPTPKRGTYALPEGTHKHSQDNGQNPDKSLIFNDTMQTTDISPEKPHARAVVQESKSPRYTDIPSPCSKSVSEIDRGGGDQTLREKILTACNVDPVSGLTGIGGQMIGTRADMIEVQRWQGLGLTEPDIIAIVVETMSRKRDGPPGSFSYFSQAMQRFAAQKSKPALTPIDGGQNGKSASQPDRVQRIVTAGARGTSGQDWG